MSKVRVNCFSLSLDGYGAGPCQDVKNPLGIGGERLHDWFVPTRSFQKMYGKNKGTTGKDDELAARGMEKIGAWILGRNMFGPIRGEWQDENWKGWWGAEPPYHCDVFVLTHFARQPIEMAGGTRFHFVTGGIRSALDEAMKAAKGKDVRVGGGVATVRQFLEAGLVDEIHLAVSPVLLGAGEPFFPALDLPALGFSEVEFAATAAAAHYVMQKKS
jgi:dihydrofolate reductase